MEAQNAKGAAIGRAKAAHFKQAVGDVARGRRGILSPAHWAKERRHFPLIVPTISNFVVQSGIAMTPSDKAEVIKTRFFPPMPNGDLSDIPNASYPAAMPFPKGVLKRRLQVS